MDLGREVQKLEALNKSLRLKGAGLNYEDLPGSLEMIQQELRSLKENVEKRASERFELIQPWIEHCMSTGDTRYEVEDFEPVYSRGRIGIYLTQVSELGRGNHTVRQAIMKIRGDTFRRIASNVGLDYITLLESETTDRKL